MNGQKENKLKSTIHGIIMKYGTRLMCLFLDFNAAFDFKVFSPFDILILPKLCGVVNMIMLDFVNVLNIIFGYSQLYY